MARSRTSARARTITPDELHAFPAAGGASRRETDLAAHLAERVRDGYVRAEWCFVAERGARIAGRIAFWARPSSPTPREFSIDPLLLDLPWRSDYLVVGRVLLRHALAALRQAGATRAGMGVDIPSGFAGATARRLDRLLRGEGWRRTRETLRFRLLLYPSFGGALNDKPGTGGAPPMAAGRGGLTYRTLEETGERAFIDAVRVVTQETLDPGMRRAVDMQGAEAYASGRFARALARVNGGGWRVGAGWWQLAYTSAGTFVGLVMPVVTGSGEGTIDYIGVAPDQRGRHYSDELLGRAATALAQAGVPRITTDTDVDNWAMAAAFRRAGWEQFASSVGYSVDLSAQP